MRTVFSSWAYGESAADLDRAEGTLVFALLAGAVPALLAWLLASVGGAAMDSAAGSAAAVAPLLLAGATLVRWIGLGVLMLIVPVYVGLAIAQHRRAHGLAPELSAWALVEVYVASAAAALAGFVWLT